MLQRRSPILSLIILGICIQPVLAQYQSSVFSDSNESFSGRMRGGSQGLSLLALPTSLDQNRDVWNRSLGGISGSSFETQVATSDQAQRPLIKSDPVYAFAAPSIYQVYNPGAPNSLSERLFEAASFEQHFSAPDFHIDDSFRKYAPRYDRSFRMTGGRRRSKSIDSLFAN